MTGNREATISRSSTSNTHGGPLVLLSSVVPACEGEGDGGAESMYTCTPLRCALGCLLPQFEDAHGN